MIVGPFGSNGPIRSIGSKFLLSKDLDGVDRQQVLNRLLTATIELARSIGVSLHFPRIRQADDETLELLAGRNCRQTRDFPLCYLDIEWDDFDGYLSYIGSFSAKMRRNIKEEMNRFRRSGVTIEPIDHTAVNESRLQELADEHYQRLNHRPFPYSTGFLGRLKKHLGNELVLYGAFRSQTLIGFVMMVKKGQTAYLPLTGIDSRLTGNEATYFNLVYYRPIEDAISEGLKRLYYGGTLYRLKVRRGCKIMALNHCYLGSSPARHAIMKPWFAFHAAWMGHRVDALEDIDQLRQWRT
jgi:predicted N-acyltransferase